MPVRADGVRLAHGSRDTYCVNAPAYRAASRRIVTAPAERYGAHPATAMWHVHNEYGIRGRLDVGGGVERAGGELVQLSLVQVRQCGSGDLALGDQLSKVNRHNPCKPVSTRRNQANGDILRPPDGTDIRKSVMGSPPASLLRARDRLAKGLTWFSIPADGAC
ncbi:beta-galactosidase [Nonomuraea jabiensis]|uniref:beta-galactosidase n=1 Tax=Nonomuraea jabiensis TaxID=882448 RepID=UPI003D74D667